jgi:hypothetical protein
MTDSKPATTEEKLKPPVGAVQWFAEFFKVSERIKIDKVDNTFLTTNNIVPSGSEYKVIGGLRFLDLIKEDGSATERMKSLSVVGAEYQKNFEKMVRDAYALVFNKVKNIEQALADDVVNCFRVDYGMAPSTAKQGAQIFVFLAQKSGIALSQSIADGLEVSLERKKTTRLVTRKPKEPRKEGEPESAEEGKVEPLPEETLGRFTLKGVGYVDIKDEDTFGIAKAYLKVLAKKLGIIEGEES